MQGGDFKLITRHLLSQPGASLVAQTVKNLPAVRETRVRMLGWENPLEKGMATHSSILAWRIPGTEEPGGLQSMGSQRVGHDWAAISHSLIHQTLGAPCCYLTTNQWEESHTLCSPHTENHWEFQGVLNTSHSLSLLGPAISLPLLHTTTCWLLASHCPKHRNLHLVTEPGPQNKMMGKGRTLWTSRANPGEVSRYLLGVEITSNKSYMCF